MGELRRFAEVPVVWEPTEDSGKRLEGLKEQIETRHGILLGDYRDLHRWSVEHPQEFWAEMWDWSGVVCSERFQQVLDPRIPFEECPRWFEGARLNFAENLLKYRDDHKALIVTGEDRKMEIVTYAQMFQEVELYASAFRRCGLKKGDRVACYLSNRKEAILAFLAAVSVGATWAGSVPDLGAQAVLKRFKQIHPKILLTMDESVFNRVRKDLLHKVGEIANGLPTLEKVIVVPSRPESRKKDIGGIRNSCFLDDFLQTARSADGTILPLRFEQVSFSHPVLISYTSGTTGLPKALVHGAGALLSVSRDFGLHLDSSREDVWFSASQPGWISWTLKTTVLFLGLTMVLFEGFPHYLGPTYFWDLIDEFKITTTFTMPIMLDRLEVRGYLPSNKNHLTSLKHLVMAGTVSKPQNFDFVREKIKKDIAVVDAYGSTEALGFWMMSDSSLKIYRGEISSPCLGVDIRCLDEDGKPVEGEMGELFLMQSTPTQPLGFWGDSDGSRFRETYFSKISGKFATGDLAVVNPVTKGIIMRGRSDDTLKVAGNRFGSSEIYDVVETFPEVLDSLCVSQYNRDREERAVLFLKTKEGHRFDEDLVKKIRKAIAEELSIEHVPAVILQTQDIPYNVNGKKMERVVKNIINGLPHSSETVANPECLSHFCDLPELAGY